LFRKSSREVRQAPSDAAPQPPPPPIDPLLGDPDAHRFQAELAEGRWQEFHEFLQSVTDWEHRFFYVYELSNFDARPGWLDAWATERPDSALPYLFRGAHGVSWAWFARGSGWASTVGEDAWKVFHTRLVDAERDLRRAAAFDPTDPTPHARSIMAAVGLALGLPEIRRRFTEVTHRSRWHRQAHHSMLQALAAKWYGSHEQMFEFARAASAQAPEGDRVHSLVAAAHLERWLNLTRESADGLQRQRAYFRDPMVSQEIQKAAARCVRSPNFTASRLGVHDRNIFAMCFALMRDFPAQLEQMRLIGPMVTTFPWQFLGDPGQSYQQHQRRALAELARQGPAPRASQ
jgi:hypothetical protein